MGIVWTQPGFIPMYIISYKFIATSQRNDAHKKYMQSKNNAPNNLVQKGIELRVCLQP